MIELQDSVPFGFLVLIPEEAGIAMANSDLATFSFLF